MTREGWTTTYCDDGTEISVPNDRARWPHLAQALKRLHVLEPPEGREQ